MKKLLLEIERFLRWLADLTPNQRTKHSAEISELSHALADQLETETDQLED